MSGEGYPPGTRRDEAMMRRLDMTPEEKRQDVLRRGGVPDTEFKDMSSMSIIEAEILHIPELEANTADVKIHKRAYRSRPEWRTVLDPIMEHVLTSAIPLMEKLKKEPTK